MLVNAPPLSLHLILTAFVSVTITFFLSLSIRSVYREFPRLHDLALHCNFPCISLIQHVIMLSLLLSSTVNSSLNPIFLGWVFPFRWRPVFPLSQSSSPTVHFRIIQFIYTGLSFFLLGLALNSSFEQSLDRLARNPFRATLWLVSRSPVSLGRPQSAWFVISYNG